MDCSYEITAEVRTAIQRDDLRTVKKLIAKCPAILHHNIPHKWPVIHECLSRGCLDLELLELFVRTGGDVNQRTESGVSISYLAAMLCKKEELVQFLKENGATMSPCEEATVLMKDTTPENRRKHISQFRKLLETDPHLVHEAGDRG